MSYNVTTAPLTPARRRAMLDRSLAKSQEQVMANNLPRVIRQDPVERMWAVASRTEGGVIYLLTESRAGELRCDCPAEGQCWHLRHVSRAIAGVIGHHAAPARPRLLVDALTLSGNRRGRYATNLTDGAIVHRRRKHGAAIPALEEVVRCLSAGHVPAFAGAFDALVTTAVADDCRPETRQTLRSSPTGQAAD